MTVHAQGMTVQRAGEGVRSGDGGVATGAYRIQPLRDGRHDGDMTVMRARFDAGVISHWHSHPAGQLLHVLDGIGLVQCAGGEVVEVHAGDTVWFAPGERHWHGAGHEVAFEYLSIQPLRGGTAVHWHEPVVMTGQRCHVPGDARPGAR